MRVICPRCGYRESIPGDPDEIEGDVVRCRECDQLLARVNRPARCPPAQPPPRTCPQQHRTA